MLIIDTYATIQLSAMATHSYLVSFAIFQGVWDICTEGTKPVGD